MVAQLVLLNHSSQKHNLFLALGAVCLQFVHSAHDLMGFPSTLVSSYFSKTFLEDELATVSYPLVYVCDKNTKGELLGL